MSYFGKFYITGPDAQTAVDWIFSNNMQKSPGMPKTALSMYLMIAENMTTSYRRILFRPRLAHLHSATHKPIVSLAVGFIRLFR